MAPVPRSRPGCRPCGCRARAGCPQRGEAAGAPLGSGRPAPSPLPPPRACSGEGTAGADRHPAVGRPGRRRALRQHSTAQHRPVPRRVPPRLAPAGPGRAASPGNGIAGEGLALPASPERSGAERSGAAAAPAGGRGGASRQALWVLPTSAPRARTARTARRRGRAPHVTRTQTRHWSAGGEGRGRACPRRAVARRLPPAAARRPGAEGLACPVGAWQRARGCRGAGVTLGSAGFPSSFGSPGSPGPSRLAVVGQYPPWSADTRGTWWHQQRDPRWVFSDGAASDAAADGHPQRRCTEVTPAARLDFTPFQANPDARFPF